MPNQLEIVQQIQQEITNINRDLQATLQNVVAISREARNVNFSGVSTPSGFNTALEASRRNTEQLNVQIREQERLERQLITQIARRQLVTESTNRAVVQNRTETQIQNQELRNQVRATTELGTAYTRLQAQNNILIRQRQDLAVRQRTNNDLTEQETQRLNDLTSTIQRNQRILRETDAEVGRFQRNVGNYTNSWNGLGNSINQITREFPAFVVSTQTGILALSNNIPVLVDEVNRLRTANQALVAQGQPVVSVFSQITRSIFSWQTLISVGVTLLTVYGREIGDFVSGLFNANNAVDELTTSTEELNEAIREGTEAAAQEITTIEALFEIARDVTVEYDNRIAAADRLIETTGGLISEQERLNLLDEDSIRIQRRVIEQINNRNVATSILATNAERNARIGENLIRLDRVQLAIIDRTNRLEAAREILQRSRTRDFREFARLQNQVTREQEALNVALREEDAIITQNNELRAENNRIIQIARDLVNNSVDALTREGGAREDTNEAIEGSIGFLEQLIARLEQERNNLVTNTIQYQEYTVAIDEARESLIQLQALFEAIDFDPFNAQVRTSTDIVREAFGNILESFNIGDPLTESFEQASDTIDDELGGQLRRFRQHQRQIVRVERQTARLRREIRQEFAESAIEGINAIFEAQIERYEQDIEANRVYFDALLENEELTDAQREELENRRNQREQELRAEQEERERQAFLFNQALALAEIGLNLAQTLTAIQLAAIQIDAITPFALGATGAAYRAANIPLAIATAAAQTATVVAQSIPAFAEGKGFLDNYEGPAIWGEKKREIKISKDGTVELSPRRIANHLTHVKRDDIILPDAEKFINSMSDGELTANLSEHVMTANMLSQNDLADRYLMAESMMAGTKQMTRDIVRAIKSNRPMVNLQTNISLKKELEFRSRTSKYRVN